MKWSRGRWLLVGIAIVAAGVLPILLIGDSSKGEGVLEVRSDDAEKGDPELGSDRIRITPQGQWTPVFWVALENLEAGQRVGARVNIQLTNCRPSDLTPSSSSSCKGTAPYPFDPEIDWKLILAEQDGGERRSKTTGVDLGRPGRMDCTKALHHCVPVALGEGSIGRREEGTRYVALVVRARSPRAKPCRPARPEDCNVLQLTHGQGRLGVVRIVDPQEVGSPRELRSERELAEKLPLAETSAEKKSRRETVYSLEIEEPGPLVIDGELRVFFDESQPIPPLVSKELILADSPDSIEGSTVGPQNGENCIGECRYIQPGLAPCITDDDLAGGSLYLNLVAFSARESSFAKGSQPVAVRDGGHLRAQQYDASLAPGCE